MNHDLRMLISRLGRRRGFSSGYTLIEVLMVTVLLAVVTAVAMRFWWFFSESYQFSVGEALSTDRAYGATARMVRELREVQPGDDGSYAIADALDQQVIFFTDTDVDPAVERVRYTLNGETLERGVTQPTGDPVVYDTGTEEVSVVVDGVLNGADPVFFYYDENWPADTVNNPLVPAERILGTRMVGIRLLVQDPSDRSELPVEVTQAVGLRGLKRNL